MKKLLLAVALVTLAGPANAIEKGYWNRTWQCGDIEVQDNKLALHHHELSFTGRFRVWVPEGKNIAKRPFDFKFVGENGAMMNGKMCELINDDSGDVKKDDQPQQVSPNYRPRWD
jgi:hypothetical protein